MYVVRCCAVALGLVLAGAASAQRADNKLPDAAAKALDKADALEVYSLGGETGDKAAWHGAKVLGRTIVKGETEIKALASALKKGVADGDRGTRCFIPRHGVRITFNDTTYDFLICFECGWVYAYTGESDKPAVLMTTDAAQKALNKILTDARIPLDKPAK